MRYVGLLALFTIATASTANYYAPFDVSPTGWAAKNWGLYNTTAKSHVSAVEAWAEMTSRRRVTVAVIDTGIDLTHEAIYHDISKYGWNFVSKGATEPQDNEGHGTHIAGIIDAMTQRRALLVPIKYYSDASPGRVNLRNTVKAFRYAVDHGAKIINYSSGGPEFDEQEYLAMKYAEAHGVLIVAAAGNERSNSDTSETARWYPASYNLSNIISVMGNDINNNRLPSSNWGKLRVDLSAPGENIFSTLTGNRYGYMSGTSQATPFVTGTAVLMLSENPKLTPRQIKKIICESVDPIPQLQDLNRCGGRLNAHAAILKVKGLR